MPPTHPLFGRWKTREGKVAYNSVRWMRNGSSVTRSRQGNIFPYRNLSTRVNLRKTEGCNLIEERYRSTNITTPFIKPPLCYDKVSRRSIGYSAEEKPFHETRLRDGPDAAALSLALHPLSPPYPFHLQHLPALEMREPVTGRIMKKISWWKAHLGRPVDRESRKRISMRGVTTCLLKVSPFSSKGSVYIYILHMHYQGTERGEGDYQRRRDALLAGESVFHFLHT
ncbi:hypothetical protein CEXT_145841 [Caerostris extrusa]|uniref:Uncharacterized protein n=1 Tax=Caerostris extrusa TaxID=172846 RepID=A0AAV4W948_CAEEX|nr:hypothetical protein CEXT_145841 [Caerostris extrusa]